MGLGQTNDYLIYWANIYLLSVRENSYLSEGCQEADVSEALRWIRLVAVAVEDLRTRDHL